MNIIRYQPTRIAPSFSGLGGSHLPFSAFERSFDRLVSSALSDFAALSSALEDNGGWNRFAVDLYEDKDNYYVRAELPGFDRKEFNVEMVDDYLTISGTRKEFGADGKETRSATFSRSVAIPEAVQADKVSAAYEDGVLTVTLPKREEAKPRKITVEVK
jgi:HSP20 family protein